ncbi:MAG: CapA family protein [Chloroflexales bacterium]
MPRPYLAAMLIALAALLAPPAPVRAQRADSLDQPLLGANFCGPGDRSETPFTLAATGDTFPHENIQAVGEAQGYATLFDDVRPFLQAADLAYTNFDGAMLEGAGYTGYPTFNYNPALATALKGAGIGLVSTANNHILDRGSQGLDATLGVLDANGILHHGAIRSDATAHPAYTTVTLTRGQASVKLGFLSATWGTNGIDDPNHQVNLLYQGNSYGEQGGVRQSVLDAVAQAAAATDLVIVAAHWGYEYQFYPDTSQLDAARRLAEAGADIILGAQSHTLQPVDFIDTGGRKTLVIYSLANFLASQGAFQAESFAATATIFYIGLARSADGTVRVTGYRYLPTIHVAGDTRPAPMQPGTNDAALAHVRLIMRDPGGARQVPATPPAPGARIEVCPPLTLAETPNTPITGDFAQHYATLGGVTLPPLTDSIAALGLPLGPATVELAGDCTTPVPILYTERQRLELHADAPWPYRVTGSQLGASAFARRYPGVAAVRRTNLAAPDAFADSRFRAFYAQHGGLAIFGYPLSGALNEDQPETGVPTTVQYFERARFELAPATAPGAALTAQVRLGLLGRELLDTGGVAALCPGAAPSPLPPAALGLTTATASATAARAAAPAIRDDDLALIREVAAQIIASAGGWILLLAVSALVVAILALATFAFTDWQSYQRRGARHGYRRRRSAYERFADQPIADERVAEQPIADERVANPSIAPPSFPKVSTPADDDLLRSLLEG